MPKLFVDKTIKINAPASRVWDALTKRKFTDEWVPEFSSGGPQFHLESDWKLGSPVLWKGEDRQVIVEGTVTALAPNQLLRFTVFDVRSAQKPPVTEKDGITYELTEENGKTTLHLLQGDFSVMAEGEKYHRLSAEIWDRVLPKIKGLAETQDLEEEPTCGKGLAENASLPAKLGEIIASVAENLEVHMKALDLKDQNAKQEYKAYQKLVQEHREIATRLTATAAEMASYRDLPMGKHDEEAMSDPKVLEAFKKLITFEQDLMGLLQKRAEQHQEILAEMQNTGA
jgi:uncharacterized protein YndB with AHSA1/START domain